jgi:TolB-like protein
MGRTVMVLGYTLFVACLVTVSESYAQVLVAPPAPAPAPATRPAAAPAQANKIVITSNPSGAAVGIDGRQMGVTPYTFMYPSSGKQYIISVSRSGYITETKNLYYNGGEESLSFVLRNQTQSAQYPSTTTHTSNSSATKLLNNLDKTVEKAIVSLIKDLPQGSTLAVVNVSSKDGDASNLALSEIEFQLVSAKKFKIVDRRTLDAIRNEQQFQMGGAVADETIIAIGNLAGASVVITGEVTAAGNNNRFTVKALDVKSGQILSMARENY